MKRSKIGIFIILFVMLFSVSALAASSYQTIFRAFGWDTSASSQTESTASSAQPQTNQTNTITDDSAVSGSVSSSSGISAEEVQTDSSLNSAAEQLAVQSSDNTSSENTSSDDPNSESSSPSKSNTGNASSSGASSDDPASSNSTSSASSAASSITSEASSPAESDGHAKSSSSTSTIPITGISLNQTDITIKKGDTYSLSAGITPSDTTESKAVTWASADSSVATVDSSGVVTAVKAGSTTISAKASGVTATCNVTVTVPATKIILNMTNISLEKGDSRTLTATVSPTDSTDKIAWATSDNNIVEVDSSGVVTAIGGGTATVTASSEDGTVTASCTVTVGVSISSLQLSDSTLSLIKGNTKTLSASIIPADTTESKTITWSSSDNAIATVDSSGTVTAIEGGSAIITALNGTHSAQCTVTVSVPATGLSLNQTSVTIAKGSELTLTAEISPTDTTDSEVSWVSSDSSIASVDSTGKVTASGVGTAIIKATDGGLTASCQVTVIIPTSGLTLDKATLNLIKGNSEVLMASIVPPDSTDTAIAWSSSNTNVAAVDSSGAVTAVEGGTAIITATTHDGGFTASCTVTVTVPVTGVSLDKSTLGLIKGNTVTLTATISPADATDKALTWSSSNTSAATVDSSGKVTAVEGGTATVTATTHDGSFTASCTVTVTVPVTGVSLDQSTLSLIKGNTGTLTATISPTDATDKAVTWSSSNISAVTVDSSGKVTAVEGGTATITATSHDGGFTASCTVTVTVPVTGVLLDKAALGIIKGNAETLTATISPADATDKAVTWSSSNTSAATVDSSGKVTAVEGGTATVTATTHDGGFTASCAVTVTVPVSGVSLNKMSDSLSRGTSETLVATVNPADASNKSVIWCSSNTSVATVNSSGTVTAVSGGIATITARTSDGGYTATCQVSVPCILTVSAGSGGTVSGGGIYAYGITATLTATPNSEWYFVNWSDGSTVQTRTITVTSDFTLTANFHLAPVTWTAVNGSSNTYNLVGATPTASVQIGTAGVNYGYGTVTYTFSEPLTLKATNGIEVNTNISSNSTTELCARSDYGYFYFGDGSHSTVSDVYYSYSQFSSSNPFGGTSNAISEIEVGAVGEGNGTKPNACGTITVTLYPEEGNPIVLTSAGISYR